jgi:hypothetical protein
MDQQGQMKGGGGRCRLGANVGCVLWETVAEVNVHYRAIPGHDDPNPGVRARGFDPGGEVGGGFIQGSDRRCVEQPE